MNFNYSADFEILLKDESEKSECMSIMHLNASNKYNVFANILNIPVIALSSFIGFFTALQLFSAQNIILGCLGIGVGMLKTIDSYFDFTKRAEQHRLISLRYSKISKLIQVQLSLEKNNRIDAKDFYYLIVNDLANLKDSEPLIPDSVIKEFTEKYKDYKTAKPAICNGLTKIKILNKNEIKSSDDIEMKNIFLDLVKEEKKEDEKKEDEKKEEKREEPIFENIDDQIENIKSSKRFKNND